MTLLKSQASAGHNDDEIQDLGLRIQGSNIFLSDSLTHRRGNVGFSKGPF